MKSRPQRDSNHHSSDSKLDALSVRPCGRWKVFEMRRFKMLQMPMFYCKDEQILGKFSAVVFAVNHDVLIWCA